MPPDNDNDQTVGQVEPPKKVIYAFGAKPKENPTPDPSAPDSNAIELLEMMLERFKKGELTGFAMVAGIADENGAIRDAESWVSNRAFDNYLAFIGATSILRDHLQMEMMPIVSEGA